MAGYKKPCLYCNRLIPSDSDVCPLCGRKDPLVLRCPKCRNPVKKEWNNCNSCGLELKIICPNCKNSTFLYNTCEHCKASLLITCKKCKTQQLPIGEKCIKCGKPLK